MAKDDGAFLTIGELAQQLGVAQHILRYWETRFPQLRPLQRSGNRRYYRPHDVQIAQQINRLLNEEGFTVRGAQRALTVKKGASAASAASAPAEAESAVIHAERVAPPVVETTVAPSSQGELPIGDAPPTPVKAPAKVGTVQVAPSDLALLIARLTVIRQNLVDALDPD